MVFANTAHRPIQQKPALLDPLPGPDFKDKMTILHLYKDPPLR